MQGARFARPIISAHLMSFKSFIWPKTLNFIAYSSIKLYYTQNQ